MKPERWRRVEELFEAASELAAGARESFLEQACDGDEALRREVESLLAFDRPGGESLNAPVQSMAARMAADGVDGHLGRRLGPWRITGVVGEGGMGVVYLAVRDDDQYQKQVAIKCIKRGMDTALVLQRFRHERQILAGLEHSNIARLLDGGTAGDGLPYFVMEYVPGTPITRHCEDRKLPLRERLELFRQVCAGVQHAHRHMVVHRDLKPDNILVTAEGIPKLLDFGIAKLLDPSLIGELTAVTGAQVRIFTPEYASPEQVRGPADHRGDRYLCLGRHLVRTPDRAKSSADERFVSTRVRPRDLRRGCREAQRCRAAQRDADRKPQAESPTGWRPGHHCADGDAQGARPALPLRRIEQLSEDIRRYMDDLPVQARSDTLGYRTAKFVRRNYPFVIAALAVFLSLVAGIVVSVVQQRRAEEQARRAEFRFQQVRKLANSFLFDFHNEISSGPSPTGNLPLTGTRLKRRGVKGREREAGVGQVQAELAR